MGRCQVSGVRCQVSANRLRESPFVDEDLQPDICDMVSNVLAETDSGRCAPARYFRPLSERPWPHAKGWLTCDTPAEVCDAGAARAPQYEPVLRVLVRFPR